MLAGIAIDAAGRQHPLTLSFTAGAFRADEIFDSANCPPSRYLIEVGRRLLEACPTAERLVIGNPLLPLTAAQLAGWMPQQAGGDAPFILSDRASFPLLYILPRRLFDEGERFLLLLSSCDGVIDRRLLSRFAGVEAERVGVSSFDIGEFPISTVTGWFMGRGRQEMLRILALQALETIDARPDWRGLPFAAYLPYHAGSLLLLTMAARQVAGGFFDKVVACASYRDIVETASSGLEPVWLRLPWLPRDNSVGELDYVIHAMKRLGPDVRQSHFFGFLRYSRLYDHTPFHLLDQMKFAVGHSMRRESDTVHGAAAPPVRARAALPPQPLRLLFHLAGGWKLKSYRADHAGAIFTALRALGCEISVVDQPALERYGARSMASDSTALLTETVRAHHIFIGVDSFPHHFVRHVLGWPTIGLFANTKPCNSDAKQGDDYRALVGAVPCNPCGANGRCPVLGAEDCANFAPPEQVVSAILSMARAVYGFTETM
jgi:hypothetical protein